MRDAETIPLDIRVDVIRHYSKKPVKTPQDLWRLGSAVAGHPWIRNGVCRAHQRPWDLVEAVYFRRSDEILGVGARGGYKTRSIGFLTALEFISRPGIQYGHAAGSLTQSAKMKQWARKYLKSEAMEKANVMKVQVLKSTIHCSNGSELEIVPATVVGFNSLHPQVLVLDEFELVKADLVDEARLIPKSFDGYTRMMVEISSRKYRNGNVDKILYDRRYKDVLKIIWCILDVLEACPEERRGAAEKLYENVEDIAEPDAPMMLVKAWEKCGSCGLLGECRGLLSKAEGWAPIDDALSQLTVDRTTWISQMRGMRVREERGRVFPKFSRARNVTDVKPVMSLPLHLVVDFSGGGTSQGAGATGVLFYQVVDRRVHVLAEYVRAGGGIRDDVEGVEAILRVDFPELRVVRCIADSSSPLLIREWNQVATRFKLQSCRKMNTKREMIMALQTLVEPARGDPKWIINPRCTVHIEEMFSFRYTDRIVSGRIKQAAYRDVESDTVDPASYVAVDLGRLGPSRAETPGGVKRDGEQSQALTAGSRKRGPLEFTWNEYIGDKIRRLRDRRRF